MPNAVIDGDWLVFMIANAANSEAKKTGGALLALPLVYKICDNWITKLNNDLDTDGYAIILTGKGNFRKYIPYDYLPTDHPKYSTGSMYKANRKGRELPPYLQEIRNHLETKHNAFTIHGCEADDGLGIWITENPDDICVAVDKDLNMIVGHHYNPRTKVEYDITKEEAYYNYCLQLLTGDSIDNIPGFYSVFKKKITKSVKEELLKSIKNQGWDETNYIAFGSGQWLVQRLVEKLWPDIDRSVLTNFLIGTRKLIHIHALEPSLNILREKYNDKT